MPWTPPQGVTGQQVGAVAEAGYDIVAVLTSAGKLRTARTQPDDHGFDRLVYVPSSGRRVLAVNPKGSHRLQDGRAWAFRVVMEEVPKGDPTYRVVLCPVLDEAPWVGASVWDIPGPALHAAFPSGKPAVIEVAASPRPGNRWEQFRTPRAQLGARHLTVLGARPPAAAGRSANRISRPAQGFVLESANFCHLTMASAGLLHLWRPYIDIQGLDQAVNFAGDPSFLLLQPKGVLQRNARGLIQVHLKASTFHDNPHMFVVILEMDPRTMALGPYMWFIPSSVVAKQVEKSRGAFVWMVSPDPAASRGEFLPYRHPTRDFPSVVGTALAVLAREGRGARLPSTVSEIAAAQRSLLGSRASARASSTVERVRRLREAARHAGKN